MSALSLRFLFSTSANAFVSLNMVCPPSDHGWIPRGPVHARQLIHIHWSRRFDTSAASKVHTRLYCHSPQCGGYITPIVTYGPPCNCSLLRTHMQQLHAPWWRSSLLCRHILTRGHIFLMYLNGSKSSLGSIMCISSQRSGQVTVQLGLMLNSAAPCPVAGAAARLSCSSARWKAWAW